MMLLTTLFIDSCKIVIIFFCFFKQKTAYEILAYWSSDVCSSDLLAAAPLVARVRHPRRHRGHLDRRAAVARARAAAAAGGAGRRPGHQRPRLDERLRLRPHLEPRRAAGERERRGQRMLLPRLPACGPG